MKPLSFVLATDPNSVQVADLNRETVAHLRQMAKAWNVLTDPKMSREACIAALKLVLKDDQAGKGFLNKLGPDGREVLSIYRRYGGLLDGTLARLELLSRDLVRINEKTHLTWTIKTWSSNPIETLIQKGALIAGNRYSNLYYSESYQQTDGPFAEAGLHPALVRHVPPAEPTPWTVPPLSGNPKSRGSRSVVEVVLDLARIAKFIKARGGLKSSKTGTFSPVAIKPLVKGVPLANDADFPLPDGQALLAEILLICRVLNKRGDHIDADLSMLGRLLALPSAEQARIWTRIWIQLPTWRDGLGVSKAQDDYHAKQISQARRVLAWGLGALAREESAWFDLYQFLTSLFGLIGRIQLGGYDCGHGTWDPGFPHVQREPGSPSDQKHAFTYQSDLKWLANMTMVTLPALGLVERGQTEKSKWCFRLTPLGRGVFGAPEVLPPEEPTSQPFFVVQPNFDVVAYLDRATAKTAGTLALTAESDPSVGGMVRTFRLTSKSVYEAMENGLPHAELVTFLTSHNQGELPANVARTLSEWSSKRESLVLRTGVNLLAFADTPQRDAWLAKHPQGGQACGDHFILATESPKVARNAIYRDHQGMLRHCLDVTEDGVIKCLDSLDVVMAAQLARFADKGADGWRITGTSVGRARQQGLKSSVLDRWLDACLIGPVPPMLHQAIYAWLGEAKPLQLAKAVLLRVTDEDLFKVLSESERIQPLVIDSPGPGWFLVRESSAAELKTLLTALGFTLEDHLPTV